MTLARRQRAALRLHESLTMRQLTGVRGAAAPAAQPETLTKAFFDAFLEGADNRQLVAERFDYDAVDLWLTAQDSPVLADQSSLIRRLLRRRRTPVSTPLITAYEEQDPHFGRWTLATLLYEKYGEFKIQNNSYIHLNYPPTALPPQEQRIHLCWGIGWDGATQPTSEDERWHRPAGSILNAVVALIIDDWRGALAPLPVRFELHRMNPMPFESDTGRRRRRWHLLRPHPVPPARAVAALFERVNVARTFASPWTILSPAEGRRNWWVACVFEADLRALGFRPDDTTLRPGMPPAWRARVSGLPRGIEHVIVVPPQRAPGSFYRVRRSERMTVLEPQRSARTTAVPVDDYLHLRAAALDLALNELSSRMD